MSQFDYKEFYERSRPHFYPPGATLFITFRLVGSIPKALIRTYKAQKEWLENEIERISREKVANPSEAAEQHLVRLIEFQRQGFRKFEEILHQEKNGAMWLRDKHIAQLVAEKLHKDDEEKYRLHAYCIMSNHVHVVFTPLLDEAHLQEKMTKEGLTFVSEQATLAQIMQSLKGVTAREANLTLQRSGAFWEHESYDHVVRDEAEFYRVIKYTLNNPVKAHLVQHWREWAGNYLASYLQDWAWSW